MSSRKLIALASCLLASQANANLHIRQTPSGACSTGVHVIAAGGANSNDPYALGLLTTLATNITNAIPGSDYVSLPYDKVQNNGTLNADAVPGGLTNLQNYVTQYHSACPNGKIVLAGYSSGAIIVMNGLCSGGLSQALADNTIIATVVYGDETRVSGLSYDQGTCTGNGIAAARRNPAQCGAFIPGIQSYCDANDPDCCSGPQSDLSVHYVYPAEYDLTATSWVVKRWQSLGGSASSSTGSSSPAASTSHSNSTGSSSGSTSSSSSGYSTQNYTAAAAPSSKTSSPAVYTGASSNVLPALSFTGATLVAALSFLW
ncbi:carbohydrate esterase family 5 protein [Myriangium duriaei CBS 260.36]|uniref:Carbohydrate esterase family 5 protein n=1 Tax=Myriangium duriaei CBS 260.36 TaxID=1168546 RepID=A0A9P4IRA4_9PEZI|nr:carbohydrate esterase family 5 protein [Myriangium duriaei CBS 260.36]